MVLFSVIFDCGKPRKLPHKLPNRGVIDAMMKRVVIKMTDRSFWMYSRLSLNPYFCDINMNSKSTNTGSFKRYICYK